MSPRERVETVRLLKTIARGRTMIIISHRLSSLTECDQILVLEKGKVMDIAPHRVLLERCAGAEMLVLGTAGDEPGASWSAGPVIRACLRRAPCPVVVIGTTPCLSICSFSSDEVTAATIASRKRLATSAGTPGGAITP